LRGDAGGDANRRGAGGVNGGPEAGPNASEQRGAIGCAFLGFDDFDSVAVDIGLDLPPHGRARAATAEADAGNGHIHFAEKSERVAEAEGDTFENGANDMRASVRSGEANERAARVGIEMRGALAHEIRRPQEAVGTGRNFGGFGGELVVGFANAAGICSEGIAEPAQGEASGLRDAHNVPASRDGVAKRVDAAMRIERGAIGGGKNDAGSADGGADGSSRDDAHAGSSGGLIACASDNGSADAETCFRGALAGNFPADSGRLVKGWQQAFVEFGGLQHFPRPATMGDIEKQSAGSVGHIGGAFAGEAKANVVLGKHDGANTFPVRRFVLANPKQFCKREIG